MNHILYESQSERQDGGILYLTEGQPSVLPFYFKMKYDDINEYKIPSNHIIRFIIKSDIHNIQSIIKKSYTGILNNTAVLRLDKIDMDNLYGGKEYYMSVIELDEEGNVIHTLIKMLQTRIQEVV